MTAASIAFDDSYPTGGEAITPNALGLSRIDGAIFSNGDGYAFEFDAANDKVIAYYADYDAGADGALIQVPDTTDIATVVTFGIFFGI